MSLALPGFADPVHDAQACFRAVLDAMARPGVVHALPAAPPPPAPLAPATAAVILTLCDAETPLWLDQGPLEAYQWIAFHTGAQTTAMETCVIGVAMGLPPDLRRLPAGTDDAPQDSATLILQVASLVRGTAFALRGPGILGTRTLHVGGLPEEFDLTSQWRTNHALFPRGVDLILTAGDHVAAVPRSVILEPG
jgi:alpha-D-ribose 1-methylphosphonate 5-triphosphate synthase subunit PhnH